jgi:hypothetical protein
MYLNCVKFCHQSEYLQNATAALECTVFSVTEYIRKLYKTAADLLVILLYRCRPFLVVLSQYQELMCHAGTVVTAAGKL